MAENEKKEAFSSATPCEECQYFEYDDLMDEEICTLSLDEDEYVAFLNRKSRGCPYFRSGREYDTVKKQNELPGLE